MGQETEHSIWCVDYLYRVCFQGGWQAGALGMEGLLWGPWCCGPPGKQHYETFQPSCGQVHALFEFLS